ncbi:Uncharacterized protein APZ42_022669 [Daphnia magna]|uniref:Uncharacterized protein n=1 Tax=Daphnia magna TaxID=35525 RepID=A0A164VNV5_9CRUS|nr:Uncharacterized protein APZ42_022669 [Daphnia magna]
MLNEFQMKVVHLCANSTGVISFYSINESVNWNFKLNAVRSEQSEIATLSLFDRLLTSSPKFVIINVLLKFSLCSTKRSKKVQQTQVQVAKRTKRICHEIDALQINLRFQI